MPQDLVHSLEPWLAQLRDQPPIAIVLGASINGLGFARSLGRRGIPVLLVDSEPLVGAYSRYAKRVTLPRGDAGTQALRALLTTIGPRLAQPGTIFPTSDGFCAFLADHETELRPYFRFLQPEPAQVRAILDKSAQYEVARQAGVPIPATFVPGSAADVETIAREIAYPAILKPYWGADLRPASMRDKGIKVFIANTPDELREGYARAAAMDVPVMVQEVVQGDDTEIYGYWAFWDEQGRERAWLTMRKLRQNPPGFGDGSLQQTVEAPEVAALSRRLLQAFDYRGLVGVEFKRDGRDGALKLIEINPRTEGGNQLAISAGVDFPWIAYRHLAGLPADAERAFIPGVTYVNEEADLKSFLTLHQQGALTVSAWLRSWFGARSHAIGAWDDPMPILVLAGRIARAAARKTLRRGS